ncbi:MAG: CPBP family intramembrane metalloprotease [Prolixibacteraceae bacterium]|jgi:membrane protease YdiL (CAAX protease family)|nr:CPBP family intramembrane metalloprotease [Prolixibacteraceae bacterium]
MKKAYENIHPISKLGTVALVAIISLIVVLIIAAVAAIPIFGSQTFTDLISSSVQFNADNINLLKYLQITQSVGLFVIPSIVLALLFGGKIGTYLKLNRKPLGLSILLSVIIVLSASPLINLIGIWNMNMSLPNWMSSIEEWMRTSEDSAKELTELFVKADNINGLLFNIFMIGLIPAIGEEFLFRGIIQRIFGEWTKNKHVAIWITAILFSALHLQFYGFLPRVLLGAMFGYLLIWSGNLWLPVIAHFANNTTAVIAYYLYNKDIIQMDPDSIGTNSEYGIAAIVSLVFIVVLFRLYHLIENRKKLEV